MRLGLCSSVLSNKLLFIIKLSCCWCVVMFNKFITENYLDWGKCIGMCTDGTRSTSICYGELQAFIHNKATYTMWTHCIIHKESLASKRMNPQFNLVLECFDDVVNYIKTMPLSARDKIDGMNNFLRWLRHLGKTCSW